jgi:hypothetical protein
VTVVAPFKVVDLRRVGSWDPSGLLFQMFKWSTDAPTVALRDLVSRVAPASFADVGAPVITPAGVDPILGGVRRRSHKYQGAAYQVGSELRPGDLLVPRSPAGVALLISDRLVGALASAGFYAIRPGDQLSALWLWGLLNCRSGLVLRQSQPHGPGSTRGSSGDLLELPVPLPPLTNQHALAKGLSDLEASTHIAEEEAAETWWRTADLRNEEWRLILASPQPELHLQGVPLKDYCREIVKGRPVLSVATKEQEVGSLPVADIRMLSGNAPQRWVPATADRITRVHPGDLCVAAAGERPHAAVVHIEAVADPNVYVLRLRNPVLGRRLARYLNGQDGLAFRRMLISGAFIPNLRRGDLEQLPVRKAALDLLEADPPVTPLADRLEHLLWPN